jgi:hypothetical protein
MRIGYISAEQGKPWIQETIEISAMVSGLIKHREGNRHE